MEGQKTKNIIKLNIADSYSDEKTLLAIQSNLEDYRLAFFINVALRLQLSKENKSITLTSKSIESHFSHYLFDDENNYLTWRLINNHSTSSEEKTLSAQKDLFSQSEENIALTTFLIPELKRFDYLLIIDETDDFFDAAGIVCQLESIPNVSAVYLSDCLQIKKEHLERLYF